MARRKVIIVGAAGRDFHNFNTYFRDNDNYEVVCFTAAQIPDIAGRKYPAILAGKLYPEGIPIYDESELSNLIKENNVEEVYFSYSDVFYEDVMHKSALIQAAGASFVLLGPNDTQVKSTKPLISILAVRTGCGKSQTTRRIVEALKDFDKKVVVIRHPMPYGDLTKQAVQRFATYEDLDKYECTIEEREEYEPHIDKGAVVYAGVDYEKILREAEKEADFILWDGGNNDFSFYKADITFTVADPHRAGHELKYYPGEMNFRSADYIIINKEDSAKQENIDLIVKNAEKFNPTAKIIHADSPVKLDHPEEIKGKKVLIVEDGPTLTHGEMKYGAGYIAAKNYGVKEIIDPRPYAVDSIKKTYEKYTHLDQILPAMGYGDKQMDDLQKTIDKADCDLVIGATPINLLRVIKINKPYIRVYYDLKEKNIFLKDIIKNKFNL
jgi:predicted GTPase